MHNRVVKLKEQLPFCRELHFVLKIKLFLAVLYNFEREAAVKNSAF